MTVNFINNLDKVKYMYILLLSSFYLINLSLKKFLQFILSKQHIFNFLLEKDKMMPFEFRVEEEIKMRNSN